MHLSKHALLPPIWRCTFTIALLVAGSLTKLSGATSSQVQGLRHPLNTNECPSHRYPYNIPQFTEFVRDHPLLQLGANRIATDNPVKFAQLVSDFAFGIADFAVKYIPKIGQLNSVRPYALELDCKKPKFSSILSGNTREQPIKVVWASRFSAETHLLVFRLHTYKDLVDNFFISESIRLAYAGTPKPLILERVKDHLLDFLPNVTHHIMDDTTWRNQFSWSSGTATSTHDVWDNEKRHHYVIYEELAKQYAHLADDDLVVYGDMDELADEDLLFHVKHCQLKPDVIFPINSNAVMYVVDYRYIFKSDHTPGPAFPYSLKFPQLWSFGHLRKTNATTPLRVYEKVGTAPSEPGGHHLTYLPFAPALYMKLWGVAEAGPQRQLSNPLFQHVHRFLHLHRNMSYMKHWRDRVPHPDCLLRDLPIYKNFILRVPWLMAQNVQAFGYATPCEPAFYDLEAKYSKC